MTQHVASPWALAPLGVAPSWKGQTSATGWLAEITLLGCSSLVPSGLEVQTWVLGGLVARNYGSPQPSSRLGGIAVPVSLLWPLLLLPLT